MGMAGDKNQVLVGSAPFIHHDIVLVYQFKRIGDPVDADFQVALDRCPYRGHEPHAEGIAIAALVALVTVGKEKGVGLIIIDSGKDHSFVHGEVIAKNWFEVNCFGERVFPFQVVVTKNAVVAFGGQELGFFEEREPVLVDSNGWCILPEFFAIAQVYKGESLIIIMLERGHVVVFREAKVVGGIFTALMLVGKYDDLSGFHVKRERFWVPCFFFPDIQKKLVQGGENFFFYREGRESGCQQCYWFPENFL